MEITYINKNRRRQLEIMEKLQQIEEDLKLTKEENKKLRNKIEELEMTQTGE